MLSAYATVTGADGEPKEHFLGHHSVLSRRNAIRCANCLTHLEVVAHFPLDRIPIDEVDSATFRVEIQHRGVELPAAPGVLAATAALPAGLNMKLSVMD